MSFAENVRQSRNEKQLTQEGVAELLDVSRQAISEWERGNKYPESEKLIMLAKVLGKSLDWLFEDELAEEEAGNQQTILPGIVAGLEAFSSAIDNLMGHQNDKVKMKKSNYLRTNLLEYCII